MDIADYPAYRPIHQTLCIRRINFDKRSLFGVVEIKLKVHRFPLEKVTLNCRHARLYRVTLNGIKQIGFEYRDPTLLVCPDDIKQRNLDYFCGAYMQAIQATNFENGNGELVFSVPYDIQSEVTRSEELTIRAEFSLESQNSGLHFVNNSDLTASLRENKDSSSSSSYNFGGCHMFTYYYENCNKLWFPHVDSPVMPCTWRIEITVPSELVAISSGDLVDVIASDDNGVSIATFIYQLDLPVCANKIAVVVGDFEVHADKYVSDMTHFCPPGLGQIMMHTVDCIHEIIEFMEQLLSVRLPFSCFKAVFVNESYADFLSFAGVSIFSVGLLYSEKIIDQVPKTMRLLADSIACQLFSCFITSASWSDSWTLYGVSKYLSEEYAKETFGANEYFYTVRQAIREVCNHEEENGEIILDNSIAVSNGHKSDNVNACRLYANLISPSYVEMMKLKAFLVVRLIGEKIGPEILIQVINKMVCLAMNSSKQSCISWNSMQISTNSLINSVATLCGKDLTELVNMWVFNGGHPQFDISFDFNRKRNCIELEVKQSDLTSGKKGIFKYIGPISIALQELDGPFNHVVQCEDVMSKHDIACHSKSRRIKKKKIPMSYGEEIEMDFRSLDPDIPLLWLTVDPKMHLIGKIKINMQDVLWQFLLRYERIAMAQLDAAENLCRFDSHESRQALIFAIEHNQYYYRVRITAIRSLVTIATKCCRNWSGVHTLIDIGQNMFSAGSCSEIVRSNDFSDFAEYFIQKEYISALGIYRNSQKFCPSEVVSFILSWAKFNDNRRNMYSDAMYKARLIDAISASVSPSATIVSSPDMLTLEMKMVVEEIVRFLNLDKLVPSYKFCVTVSCLRAMRNLQRNGHLPNDPTLFKNYCSENQFVDVRLAAIESLIDFTRDDANSYILSFLLDIIETDRHPYVRHRTLQMLSTSPPFNRTDANPLNTEATVDRLWNLVNRVTVGDARLRCSAIEFYHALYGRGRPYCLPKPELGVVVNLREKRADVTRGEVAQLVSQADKDEDLNKSMDTSIESLNITVSADQVMDVHRNAGNDEHIYEPRLDLPSVSSSSHSVVSSYKHSPDHHTSSSRQRLADQDPFNDFEEDQNFFTNTNVERVTDEEFHSKRQPMYLAPFAVTSSLSSDKAGKKRGKKEKKRKRKSKQTSGRCMLNDLDFLEFGSSTHAGDYDSEKEGAVSGNKTGGSSTVKLSPPSSADESSDD